MPLSAVELKKTIESLYRTEGRKIYATLVRVVADFELAEEVLHEAFAAALEQWADDGVPPEPRAWLIKTARFKAIDHIRRKSRFEAKVPELTRTIEEAQANEENFDEAHLRDDQLRLIFTCCHPALAPATQTALTLREVCGLTTEEIAVAYLTTAPTIAQRIVRGKAKIRDAAIPYVVPSREQLPERLDSVLAVIYLVFNEGYAASSGDQLIRQDLSGEAIRLGRLLAQLLPDAEALGLLALMLLHESRREARCSAEGDIILLEEQDRTLWKQDLIREGRSLVEAAFAQGEVGSYTIQAAISLAHSEAVQARATPWSQIVQYYEMLLQASDTAVIRLNWAVALAMRDGPEAGLSHIRRLIASEGLDQYHLAHAAEADLLRRLGDSKNAVQAYRKALSLARLEPEKRFLNKRLNELAPPQSRS